MAPRPKTYGTRRSHVKITGEMVNGTTADEPEPKLRKIYVMTERTGAGQGKDVGAARSEEKQDTPLQGLGKEDESTSGTLVGKHVALSRTPNVEDRFTHISPTSGSLKNRSMSAQEILPPDTSRKESGSRRKSIRRLVNGSVTVEKQSIVSNTDFESILVDHTSLSPAKANSRSNGFTEDHQPSHVSRDIDLKDTPSDLYNLAIWVAQSISRYSDKSLLSATSEPRQKDSSSQPVQEIKMVDALDNVEDVRMTRGKEKKRLQQLKEKEPANELGGKFGAEVGKSLHPRDAASVERRLKDGLTDKLKQKLFGSSSMKDRSISVIERNACGKLLFNTLVDLADSAKRDSAAVLKSALEERKTDAPFLSALKVLASSSEIMAFVKFLFSKDDAPQWEASNANESRPSTGGNSSGATTITETSGLSSRTVTSISEVEGSSKVKSRNKALDPKILERQKRSQEVIQALEVATTILVQIQRGEAGTDYITPYASGSMIPNPVGQPHMTPHGMAFGPPYPDHPTHAMPHGPPMGANINSYASPYARPVAPHPHSYASPFFNPVNQPPANYASPYANPVNPNQASGSAFVGDSGIQANKSDGHGARHDDKQAQTPHHSIVGAAIEVSKGNDEGLSQGVSNREGMNKASQRANEQFASNNQEDASKACEKADGQCVSKEKDEASNAVDLDETDIDDANKQDSSEKGDETSSDDELTDDDLMTAKTDNQDIAPPAEDHKLFTGERLGDFTSKENIDWLLTMGNGGKIPRPSKKMRMSPPSSSEADAKIQMEVNRIIDQIILCQNWRGYPGTTKHFFYASAEGQRLAAELRRLMDISKLVVNTIVPSAESKARHRFYKQLEDHLIKEKRDREIQEDINRRYAAPVHMQQWGYPPVGFPVANFPIPPPLPSNGPMEPPFVRRGNVIAVPPGGRNIEEEQKAETYGYPPMPGSRPGGSQQGQKRKRAARH